MIATFHRSPSAAAALAAAILSLAPGCSARPPPPARGAAVAAADELGPRITLASPARGAVLTQGGDGLVPVAVTGTACDGVDAIAGLTFDGTPIAVAGARGGCAPFSATHASRLGLSILHGVARSDAWRLGTLSQALLRSPAWFSATPGDPAARADGGLVLQVGAALLDDGDRATPDDAATIAERVLAGLDLDAAVGPARFAQPDADGDGHLDTHRYFCGLFSQTNLKTGFEAWKDGPLTHGAVTVDRLLPVDGGVAVQVTVAAPRLPLAVMGNLDAGCLGASRLTVTGSASATALVLEGVATLGADAAGAPVVSLPSFAATLPGLALDVDVGAIASWTGLGSAIGDAIVAQLRGPVLGAVRDAVQGRLAARATAGLASLAGHRTVALPAALGGARLLVDAGLGGATFGPQGGVLTTSLHVYPELPRPEHVAALPAGAMRLGGPAPDLAGFLPAALTVAVEDDLLNQVLHAAWLAGAFDRDLTPLLGGGLPGGRLSVFAGLPPVVMPKLGAAPGVDVGWGDVAFTLEVPAPHGTAVAQGVFSAILPVDHLEAGSAGLDLAFGDQVEAYAEVTSVNWGPAPVAREAAAAMVEGALRSLLPRVLAEAARPVPIPRLDLQALDPALPALSLSLGSPAATRLGRYEVLAGSVVVAPP
jgi:hypothetical protein